LARTFRYAPGVGTCCGSVVPRTSLFDLCSGDTDVGLKTLYRWESLRWFRAARAAPKLVCGEL
jgi:hypothetical protein